MKSLFRSSGANVFGVIIVAGFLSPGPAFPQSQTKPPVAAQPTDTLGAMSAEERQKREDWQKSMSQVPLPKKGCFGAEYPRLEWKEEPCVAGPNYPMPPRNGPRPFPVGNGNDVAAQAPSGFIASASGSFTSSGVTSESGPIGNSGPSLPDTYTLQINTNQFPSTTACAGSPNPNCKGWEQFVYENNPNASRVGMQYWIIKYNAPCPPGGGWNQFSFSGQTDIYCWKNDSAGWVGVAAQPVANLGQINLTGAVNASGDSATLVGVSAMKTVPGDNAVGAASGWQVAEFNIFGDGGNNLGGGQASFNAGATLVPRTKIIYGSADPPICDAAGFTAESNNLTFGPNPPVATPPGPALLVTESSAGGSPSNCAAATTVGDTHLTTFSGLLYDFQAIGDFLLAETGPGFVVQTRQVSGFPTWPNAAVNTAVAVQAGKSRVVICAPGRVDLDGKPVRLSNGGQIALADGGNLVRRGAVYFVLAASGDSLRAEINGAHIDASVGLGQWPTKVRGLLANANGDVNLIESRDGEVLKRPFAFEVLYGAYATSWRVPPSESMLQPCGERVEVGVPKQPFFVKDLNQKLAGRNRAICTRAGVKEGPLLNACIIDVAMLGASAPKAFVGKPPPVAVGDAP